MLSITSQIALPYFNRKFHASNGPLYNLLSSFPDSKVMKKNIFQQFFIHVFAFLLLQNSLNISDWNQFHNDSLQTYNNVRKYLKITLNERHKITIWKEKEKLNYSVSALNAFENMCLWWCRLHVPDLIWNTCWHIESNSRHHLQGCYSSNITQHLETECRNVKWFYVWVDMNICAFILEEIPRQRWNSVL